MTIALGISILALLVTGLSWQSLAVLPPGVIFLVGALRGFAFALLFPFLAVAMTILYGDLRARARGLTTARDKFVKEGRSEPEEKRSTT